MPSLDLLGWTSDLAAAFAPLEAHGFRPARVMSEHKGGLALSWEGGELLGSPSARLRVTARAAVGDWVAFEPPASGHRAWIHEVLPRASVFVRKAAGREVAEQVIAANVDAVFLCTALGHDLNPRRLERYLALSWQSGARPVLVLTKLDLHRDLLAETLAICAEVAPGVPAHPLSALTGSRGAKHRQADENANAGRPLPVRGTHDQGLHCFSWRAEGTGGVPTPVPSTLTEKQWKPRSCVFGRGGTPSARV
jgi:ribosome biogenesis GTPase / thiamine phosphate phosphatase